MIKINAPSRNQGIKSHFSSPPEETSEMASEREKKKGIVSFERTPEFALSRESYDRNTIGKIGPTIISSFKPSPLSPAHRKIMANFRPSSYS